MTHIAILIPCTSKFRSEWETIKDTYFMKFSLNSFLLTCNKEFTYTYYLGYDSGDRIYSKQSEQSIVHNYESVFDNIHIKFIEFNNIKKGHVTKMWNVLFKQAYDDGADYFYQCGDDIKFHTKGWIGDCILELQKHNNIGLTGPMNNNNRILTQAMVSRKHMEIFGWFFPEEIINWCCDDWYNYVYKPDFFYPLKTHYCSNDGGTPRYLINDNKNFNKNYNQNINNLHSYVVTLSKKHQELLKQYVQNQNIKE